MRAAGTCARFRAFAALPELEGGGATPPSILLVTIEALRTDVAYGQRGGQPAMPHLLQLAERGLRFERAYAPSSGTLTSMASMFGMTYPTQASVRFWSKPWHGDVDRAPRLAAEEARDGGLHTFWVGHDHRSAFSRCMHGFDRGFARVSLVPAAENDPDVDDVIATRAVEALQEAGTRRFFGWVFFSSPHAPYLPHGSADASSDQRDLYAGEVRHADAALAQVFRALETLGRADDTIVIVTGDHGEELGDHGGIRHRSTVYDEQTRVPLVIVGPGVGAGVEARPTSSAYLLAWAFAELGIGTLARTRIGETFLPVLENAAGAPVVELIGGARPKTALVFEHGKLILNEPSGRLEFYDLRADAAERDNRASELAFGSAERLALARHRTIREQRQNFVHDPARSCPHDDDGASHE